MQISSKLSHVVKVKKNQQLPLSVAVRVFSKPSPTTFPTMQRSHHRGLLLTTISTEDHLGLPGVSASAKISNWLLHPPEILHEAWNTLLDWSGILTRKRGLWSWNNWRIDEYRQKNMGGFSRWSSVKKYQTVSFAPWKEDIESSQKDPKGEGIIFSPLPHSKKPLHVFVLLVCIPSNCRVSLSILRLENQCKTHLRSITFQPSILAAWFI